MSFGEFIRSCAIEGWDFFFKYFLLFDSGCVVVIGFLLWCKRKHQDQVKQWEPTVRKWVFGCIAVTSIISWLVIAPYRQYRKAQDETDILVQKNKKLSMESTAYWEHIY